MDYRIEQFLVWMEKYKPEMLEKAKQETKEAEKARKGA